MKGKVQVRAKSHTRWPGSPYDPADFPALPGLFYVPAPAGKSNLRTTGSLSGITPNPHQKPFARRKPRPLRWSLDSMSSPITSARVANPRGGSMPSFKVPCPSCENPVLITNSSQVGTKVECPKCKYRFKVEEPAGGIPKDDKADKTSKADKGKKKA